MEREKVKAVRAHLIGPVERGCLGASEVHDIERLCSVIETLDRTGLKMIANATLETGKVRIELDVREVTSRLRLPDTEIASEGLTFTLPITVPRRGF